MYVIRILSVAYKSLNGYLKIMHTLIYRSSIADQLLLLFIDAYQCRYHNRPNCVTSSLLWFALKRLQTSLAWHSVQHKSSLMVVQLVFWWFSTHNNKVFPQKCVVIAILQRSQNLASWRIYWPAVDYRQKRLESVSAGLALYAEKISIPWQKNHHLLIDNICFQQFHRSACLDTFILLPKTSKPCENLRKH